jgi:hypothetical protein
MLVAVLASLVGLVVVLVALAHDEPLARPTPDTPPTPHAGFPLTWPGYDPVAVEAYLDALARALAELLAGAPPEVVAHAQRLRILHAFPAEASAPAEGPVSAPVQAQPAQASLWTLDGVDPRTDDEALRAEAALTVIEATRTASSA